MRPEAIQLRYATSNTLLANAWRVVSADGGATWRESPVFGPFHLNSAPWTVEGNFVGEYHGLAAAGGGFLASFAAGSSGDAANPSSIFATSTERTGDLQSNDRIEINLHPRPYKPEAHPRPNAKRRAK